MHAISHRHIVFPRNATARVPARFQHEHNKAVSLYERNLLSRFTLRPLLPTLFIKVDFRLLSPHTLRCTSSGRIKRTTLTPTNTSSLLPDLLVLSTTQGLFRQGLGNLYWPSCLFGIPNSSFCMFWTSLIARFLGVCGIRLDGELTSCLASG